MDGLERVHVNCVVTVIYIVDGCVSISEWLFFLFVAAGTEIGDEIFGLGFLKNIREGWHGATTLKDLSCYLSFIQAASNAGEVGAFVSAFLADGVAMGTTVVGEDLCSAGTLLGRRCRERRQRRRKGNKEC
jgi:hypothetical protein